MKINTTETVAAALTKGDRTCSPERVRQIINLLGLVPDTFRGGFVLSEREVAAIEKYFADNDRPGPKRSK